MKFGFSGEAFGNLLVLNALILILADCVFFFIAHKRGVDITSRKLHLKVIIVSAGILGILPLWLTDLSIKYKLFVTVVASAVGAANYFGLDMMQKILTGQPVGTKNKNEKKTE